MSTGTLDGILRRLKSLVMNESQQLLTPTSSITSKIDALMGTATAEFESRCRGWDSWLTGLWIGFYACHSVPLDLAYTQLMRSD
jgi:hypothetical protein